MNILFVTSSRIGDAVLSTGLLDHIAWTWPQGRVTIICGPLAAPLFEGYPNLETIIPLRKRKRNLHWLGVWRKTAGKKWDIVVDLRNSIISRVIPAGKRYVFGRHIDKNLHKVEQSAAVMGLDYVPAPRLWFSEQQVMKAAELIPRQPSAARSALAVGPTANWLAKTWPAENFMEIIAWMTAAEGAMPGARVAVFAAPGEELAAREVLNSVPEERRIDLIAKTDPGVAAAALARCDFYIGNDSGLMHCAAAAGVKTLGLFGPSWPRTYRPWGFHCAYARTPEDFDELISYEGYSPETAPCLMKSLGVEEVKTKIKEIFRTA